MNRNRQIFAILFCLVLGGALEAVGARPNVLVAISDDQSYPHASAYGEPVINTPGFDAVAKRGMLFHNAFTPAPGCSPMRAAFLTGRHIWQLREAGTHGSHFPRDLKTFPDELSKAGYRTGFTGKPWGPGNFSVSGWTQNPAGPAFAKQKNDSPKGISNTDYAANFAEFLDGRDDDEPFCFWYGGHEPHRTFEKGLGVASGLDPEKVRVPAFLPDSPEIRSDLCDYFFEIQWFDQHLAKMLAELNQRGLLENTIVVVTSDNGMSFPRAKANLYEYGIHMPLAIAWPSKIRGNAETQALVNLIDITATIYDACEVQPPEDLSGKSLLGLLTGDVDAVQPFVLSGRERHSSSRWNSLGYPSRCIRTEEYLYIRNFAPERWPAGAPQKYSSVRYSASGAALESTLGPEHGGYHDIDACPSLDFLIKHRTQAAVGRLLDLAVAKRPSEELYQVAQDPACMKNLIDNAESMQILKEMRELLSFELTRTGDLRQVDFAASHVWETYPRYGGLRWFPPPSWSDPLSTEIPTQAWLEERRPR